MTSRITTLEPPPGALPDAFPSPFDELGPHPLARHTAELLQAELRKALVSGPIPTLDGPDGGKMFGVLVVQARDGRLGFLRAFSGMLDGRWCLDGFAPPMFDAAARAAIEGPGEATVKALSARYEAFQRSPELLNARAAVTLMEQRHLDERAALRTRHEANRRERHRRRAAATTPEQRHVLDQESRGDKAEKRRMEETHDVERLQIEPHRKKLERRLKALDRLRAFVSRRLMQRLHDTYLVPDAHGATVPLRSLYPHGEPPSGAGDCAAPKLLADAVRLDLKPICLAEFWWGAPPTSGGRIAAAFYGACRDKCAPLLPHMLNGLGVTAARAFSPTDVRDRELRIAFEDRWIVIVDKPEGLLSVPGRNAAVTDSVLARLRLRWPGVHLVHRLDLDTSGLLVAAKDPVTHAALQALFARREVSKRYLAWIDGPVSGDGGIIDLPIRVDLNDRPRQIHDPVHGKPALTRWEVLERRGDRTLVALFPLTGRTHQLRVHAAHPLGLGAPIVGDRLYGHPATRLLLHAERLEFRHPRTGEVVTFESPARF